MPSRDQRVLVPVETLRAAAATQAAATSITAVAKQVGLTTRGLNGFLKGAEPYLKSLQKLEAWYVRRAAEETDIIDEATAAAALSVLTHDVPPAARPGVIATALRWWAEQYAELGLSQPKWISGIEQRLGSAEEVDAPPRRRRRRT